MGKQNILNQVENKLSVDDENIKNLVKAIYYVFLMQSVYSATLLYDLVCQFCSAFDEKEKEKYLEAVWLDLIERNPKRRIDIPSLEIVLYRDLSQPSFRLNKGYNRQRGVKNSFTLGELNLKLQKSKKKMLDVFFEVYKKNGVKVEFQFPATQAGETILPKL